MKKKYLKLKKGLLVASIVMNIPLLTSCNSKKQVIDNQNQSKTQKSTVSEVELTESPSDYGLETTSSEPQTTLEPEAKITSDDAVIDYFNNSNNEINNLLDRVEDSNVKAEIFARFIKLTDFIFCDGDINGIKFNELTEDTKIKLKEIQANIDIKIDSKIPGYKEVLKDKYYQIKTYIEESETINNIKDTYEEKREQAKDEIDEKTGHENTVDEFFDSIEDDYNDVKDIANETKEKVKEKYNSWSEKYRK